MSSCLHRLRMLLGILVLFVIPLFHASGVSAVADEDKSPTLPGPTMTMKPEQTPQSEESAQTTYFQHDDEDETKEPVAKKEKKCEKAHPETVGESLAPGMMKLLQEEIFAGIKRRGMTAHFARFQQYMIGKVNASAGRYTGSELAGNCRLQWYDHLMRNVLTAPIEAEEFTRKLHLSALDERGGIARLISAAAEKLDLGARKSRDPLAVETPEQALDAVRRALIEAQVAYCAALAPLSKSEIRELLANAVPSLCTHNTLGHTLGNRGTGRRMCDLMEKMDRSALIDAAEALAPLADVKLLEKLKSLNISPSTTTRIDTPAGAIIVGGKDQNTYDLDNMADVAAVIDLGGNDVYNEGTVGPQRPVLLVIDLEGNDIYSGKNPGIQGGAVLGASMLLDLAGDDQYVAREVAQGSVLAGIGLLVDYAGNDAYAGVRRMQGQALGGIGLLIDRAGNDDYRAALWGQGMGAPLGFALLDDLDGADHYFCGGMWQDSYEETPGLEGWGQGVGAGLRQVANGGIGVILDGGGDDLYEFDYLAHGGGYWCGVGFARDFGGNDRRLVTQKSFQGGPRTQSHFQRFGTGWGCHYAMGFLFDDAGDDVYDGRIMSTGMAWDCSLGALCDFGGNDEYKPVGGLTQGTGAQMGFGILFDYNGDDVYRGGNQGYAPSSISYHDMPACGGNFSFVVDYGGEDAYGCHARNSSYVQRGDAGGFIIDRPRQHDSEATANHSPTDADAGS
ncbi:MAG: hypothetical protein JW959_07625 [Pirellulales bacterium]|nr:hypothetical protein [Pirellulales bacterium]